MTGAATTAITFKGIEGQRISFSGAARVNGGRPASACLEARKYWVDPYTHKAPSIFGVLSPVRQMDPFRCALRGGGRLDTLGPSSVPRRPGRGRPLLGWPFAGCAALSARQRTRWPAHCQVSLARLHHCQWSHEAGNILGVQCWDAASLALSAEGRESYCVALTTGLLSRNQLGPKEGNCHAFKDV